MKAILAVAPPGSIFRAVQQQLAESADSKVPDFRLSFDSAKTLFANLTPARLELLDTLRRIGPCAPGALARAVANSDEDIQCELERLEFLGLVERGSAGNLTVPYEAVEIILPLAQVA
jgi:predicted transcriptional regulator